MSDMSKSRGRNFLFIVMLGVILILAILLVWNLMGNKGETKNSAGSASESSASSSTASGGVTAGPQFPDVSPLPTTGSSAGALSVESDGHAKCDVKVDPDKAFSAEVPSDLRWDKTASGISYPMSTSVGPLYRPGYVGQCYAHSPSGAAMAAINYTAAVNDNRTTEKERRLLLSQRLAAGEEPFAPGDGGGYKMVLIGYAVSSYSTDKAKITVYILNSDNGENSLSKVDFSFVWENGDWKADTPESDYRMQPAMETPPQIFKIGKASYDS